MLKFRIPFYLFIVAMLTINSDDASAMNPPFEKDFSLYLGSLSSHYVPGEYNENHKTIGLRYKKLVFGKFTNSYYDPAKYIGYTTKLSKNWHVVGMLVTGYKRTVLPIPGIGYTIPSRLEIGNVKPELEINLLPAVFNLNFKLSF